MKTNLLLGTLLFFAKIGISAEVDTLKVFSQSMNKDVKTVVVLPEGYHQQQDLPVVYLLHGYGGSYADWVDRAPEVKALADQYSFIIVCPDGGKGSWYWDSPLDSSFQYETFVAKELVDWVDNHYKSKASREGRAIVGLSMGGHGALYLAFKHQEIFGAAGSTAGGVDIRPFPNNWDMAKRLGTYAENPKRWEENTVANMLHLLTPGSLELVIDCGTTDFFHAVNQELHKKMLLNNIQHTFISQPGAHNWDYWRKSIPYQLLFMDRYFAKSRPVPTN